jgi:hypothetical protein
MQPGPKKAQTPADQLRSGKSHKVVMQSQYLLTATGVLPYSCCSVTQVPLQLPILLQVRHTPLTQSQT